MLTGDFDAALHRNSSFAIACFFDTESCSIANHVLFTRTIGASYLLTGSWKAHEKKKNTGELGNLVGTASPHCPRLGIWGIDVNHDELRPFVMS